jgi:hypothetical protein
MTLTQAMVNEAESRYSSWYRLVQVIGHKSGSAMIVESVKEAAILAATTETTVSSFLSGEKRPSNALIICRDNNFDKPVPRTFISNGRYARGKARYDAGKGIVGKFGGKENFKRILQFHARRRIEIGGAPIAKLVHPVEVTLDAFKVLVKAIRNKEHSQENGEQEDDEENPSEVCFAM